MKDLAKLQTELLAATTNLIAAKGATEEARRVETNCLNIVNKLQKEFDEAVATFKKQASRDTDWNRDLYKVKSEI